MTAGLSTSAARFMIAIAGIVLFALLSARNASTQGTSGTEQQITVLQQQLSALDSRVMKLEIMAANLDETKMKQDEAKIMLLESQISQVMAEVRDLRIQGEDGAGSGGSQATKAQGGSQATKAQGGSQATKAQGGRSQPQILTVKAPFYVVDGGKTILAVEASGGKPKLVIGDPASGSLTVGVGEDGGGRLAITNKAGKVGIIMGQNIKGGNSVALFGADSREIEASVGTGPKGGTVRVYPHGGGSAQAELVAASDTGGGAVNVYDLQGEAVGWLEASKKGNGRFTIGRAGKIYVEAGALESGRGFVIAGPDVGGAPPGLVIPYYLEGRKPH